MTDVELQEDLPPVAHVTIVYTGPIAPHWELRVRYGDQKMLDDFWARVNARLLLLPKHDPQFRRNKERVNRDAERERITCDWDLGEDDADTSITPVAETAPAEAQPVVDEAPAATDAEPAPDPAPTADPEPEPETTEATAASEGEDAGETAVEPEAEPEPESVEQPAEL